MTGPIEIGGSQLRLVRLLWIASLALLIAIGLLAGTVIPALNSADALLTAFAIGFGLLTAALIIAPATAFLHYTWRTNVSVTPSLRRSAWISAAAPAIVGVWAVTEDAKAIVAAGGVLILLAAAVFVRLGMMPRAETNASPLVLRSGMAVLGLLVAMLASMSRPHGPTLATRYSTAMKSDLRNLVSAQEEFFDSTKRYDTSVAALRFRPSTDVNPPRISIVQSGWAATNTHAKMTGLTCAIAVKTTNPLVPSAYDAEPACTETGEKGR